MYVHTFSIGFPSVSSRAHAKRELLQVWEILVGSNTIIMMDPCKYNNQQPHQLKSPKHIKFHA